MKHSLHILLLLTISLIGIFQIQAQSTGDTNLKRANIRQASLIVAEISKISNVKKVILAGIQSGYYPDEAILFKDLLNPSSSNAYKGNRYLGEVAASAFADAFRSYLKSGNYPNSKEFGPNPNLEAFLVSTNAQLYFPYSDNFNLNTIQNFTVSFDPLDEIEESNLGLSVGRDGLYQTVTVNEPYVMQTATLIANFFEGDPEHNRIGTISSTPLTPVTPSSGSVDCSLPPTRMAVYVEEMKFTTQWDGIFKGGPEFIFCRGELEYNGDGTQVSAVPQSLWIQFKRKHKNEWRMVSALWDSRWEFDAGNKEELNQQCAVYEDDDASRTNITLTGSINVDAQIPKIGGVQFNFNPTVTHEIQSDDEVIFNQQYDRCWFITSNPTDQGLGLRNGRAVRGVGAGTGVYWTMKISPY
jgi:hypothetical protein